MDGVNQAIKTQDHGAEQTKRAWMTETDEKTWHNSWAEEVHCNVKRRVRINSVYMNMFVRRMNISQLL